MMISPENYERVILSERSEKGILREISSMRGQIKRLKREIEHPDYAPMICPDEMVQISQYRDYIARAKEVLARRGVECPTTRAEEREEAFRAAMEEISEIRLEIGCFLDAYHVYAVRLSDPIGYYTSKSYGFPNDEVTERAQEPPMSKDNFLRLLRELYLSEWRPHYSPERYGYMVFDGIQWTLTIKYAGERPDFVRTGSNSYPYNFDKLRFLLGASDEDL